MTGPSALLLLTGDELLRGFIQDANSGFVADRLRELGIELREIRIVGDDHDEIRGAIAAARDELRTDLVIVCGGLGPTHDDRTSEAVAEAAGAGLELRDDALRVVEARVRAYGRMRTPEEAATFTPGNRKQATLPTGARWVDPLGTAPGYVLATASGTTYAVLPGPPSELRHAWRGVEETPELGALLARVGRRHERLVRVWGVPESRASQVLASIGHEDTDAARVTICARDGELEIAVRGTDDAVVDLLAERLGAELGDRVFAIDDHRSVVELVAAELTARRWRLAVAESCTGGLLGAAVTAVAGSSAWFVGGVVTYGDAAKVALAGVDRSELEANGAVSEPVARAMAAGARRALGAEVGIGITGVAGPGGGSEGKPVGTVHVAWSTPAGDDHRVVRIPGDRDTVRRRTVHLALHGLRQLLVRDTA